MALNKGIYVVVKDDTWLGVCVGGGGGRGDGGVHKQTPKKKSCNTRNPAYKRKSR